MKSLALSDIVLSGFQPFEGESMADTMTNIMAARYSIDVPEFEPVSEEAKDFIKCIFKADPAERPTAAQLLQHKWLAHFNQPTEQPRPRSMRKLASVGHIKVRQQIRHDAIAKRAPAVDEDA
jgi:serine/threonine protein kinase